MNHLSETIFFTAETGKKFFIFLILSAFITLSAAPAGKDVPRKSPAKAFPGWSAVPDTFERGSIPPDKETLNIIRKALPEWAAGSSRVYTDPLYNGPPAWQIILNRPTGRRAARETNIRNAFIKIYMVQPSAHISPAELKEDLDWSLPLSELKLFTLYLGKSKGYYWYAKGDIYHLEILYRALAPEGGEEMKKIMAEALNVSDFDHFSARTAILYFKDRKDDSPLYILKSSEEWKKGKTDPPYQHLEAIRLCGGKYAGDVLTKIAVSSDKSMARKAIDLLLENPGLADERFLRKLLYLPEYTSSVLEVFAGMKKLPVLLADLENIMRKPRSIMQYAMALEAHRKISGKIPSVPEINAAAHIRLRMVRLGETKDSSKFIPLDESGTSARTEKAERKRIEPLMNVILKSKDTEAAIAAALLLASLDQGNEKFLTDEYIKRVHKTGIELLQKLPPAKVQATVEKLYNHVREKYSRLHLERIAKELGVRQ